MNFSNQLIKWYKQNKRDLPWRNTKNPYKIWLSEVILQQTRVTQGLSYYYKFIENFPTISDLANATEEEVLKLWQGLGYYSRARNLHFTAKHIAFNLNGTFPVSYNEILKLKGVGEYTAAAVSSFAYNQPFPVVDGNVFRVLTRIFGIETPIDSHEGKKTIYSLAHELIDSKRPLLFNQAIMEFGALQCVPKNPCCADCIFKLNCYAYINNVITSLPIKQNKTKQRFRYFNYLVFISEENTILLHKRIENDIWKNLYDFPLIETAEPIENIELLLTQSDFLQFKHQLHTLTFIKKSTPIKHILSHQKIMATFWRVHTSAISKIKKDYTEINLDDIENYPVPVLIENYITSFKELEKK
ncbi:MAG: A/G-specific adenine glycosylase [Bacteroidetes bacterium HGW-Bacteroidetes-12]|nr:MAG: A/G-specific adenine glycosylase [Bacteroidetes bacterium HGW-Bacteroidetes-12]